MANNLSEALFDELLPYYRFQDSETLSLYRISKCICDPENGEVTLVRSIEYEHPFADPLDPPRIEEIVSLKDHYSDIAEEIPLGFSEPVVSYKSITPISN